jgi:gamma-glutamylcysteine synthetase
MNCRDYGMFRGVFIMYCANCAKYVYDHNYGYGALQSGVEMGGSDIHKSAWNTYLKHRDPTKIGLPEELKNIKFNRVGHKYRVVSEKMFCNGQEKYVRWYPDFTYEYSDDEDYYQDNSDNHDSEFIKYVCEDDHENESNHDDNDFMDNIEEKMGSMD